MPVRSVASPKRKPREGKLSEGILAGGLKSTTCAPSLKTLLKESGLPTFYPPKTSVEVIKNPKISLCENQSTSPFAAPKISSIVKTVQPTNEPLAGLQIDPRHTCNEDEELEEKFSCNFCPELFNDLTFLETHLDQHELRPYACNLCKETFETVSGLKTHMKLCRSGKGCINVVIKEEAVTGDIGSQNVAVPIFVNSDTEPTSPQDVKPVSPGLRPGLELREQIFIHPSQQDLVKNENSDSKGHINTLGLLQAEHPKVKSALPPKFKSEEHSDEAEQYVRPIHTKTDVYLGSDSTIVSLPSENYRQMDESVTSYKSDIVSMISAWYRGDHEYAKPTPEFEINIPHCHHCKENFTAYYEFKIHLEVHETALLSICEVCGKLIEKGILPNHVRSHKYPEICQVCGEMFPDVCLLNTHFATHGSRPYACGECDERKFFGSLNTLKGHKAQHHPPPYKCGGCGICFITKLSLRNHRSTDCGNSIHLCQFCSASFSDARTRTKHEENHIMQYPCSLCFKRFESRQDLLRHHKCIHKTDVIEVELNSDVKRDLRLNTDMQSVFLVCDKKSDSAGRRKIREVL